MARLSLLVRALVLVPLLALGADAARASLVCGPRAESCLEAAGSGWLGVAGALLLVVYALGVAAGVARLARGGGLLQLWLLCSAGIAVVCAGQAVLAGAVSDFSLLEGGWLELAVLCTLAGAVLAGVMALAPLALALVRDLRPAAPRASASVVSTGRLPAPAPARRVLRFALAAPGRAPPA